MFFSENRLKITIQKFIEETPKVIDHDASKEFKKLEEKRKLEEH